MPIRLSARSLHRIASQAEKKGQSEDAVKYYLQSLRKDPGNEQAYNRLMVHYRRRKAYRKEMQIIEDAIASQHKLALYHQEEWVKRNAKRAITAKALAKTLGFVNKRGMPVVDSRQLELWRKRLAVVKKRLRLVA